MKNLKKIFDKICGKDHSKSAGNERSWFMTEALQNILMTGKISARKGRGRQRKIMQYCL